MTPMIEARPHLGEIIISIFIAVVLIAQAATLGDRFFDSKFGGRRFYPILSYMMYDDPHYEGEAIKAYYPLDVVLNDGRVIDVSADDLGLSFWNYMHLGDSLSRSQASAVNIFLHLYKNAANVRELRVKTLPLMVTRHGQAFKASQIVRTIPVGVAEPSAAAAESVGVAKK